MIQIYKEYPAGVLPARVEAQMTIRVTTEDIERGERGSDDRCPVARAMRRALSKPVCVSDHTWSEDAFMSVRHKLPNQVKAFIRAFDDGRSVKPFSFRIKSP